MDYFNTSHQRARCADEILILQRRYIWIQEISWFAYRDEVVSVPNSPSRNTSAAFPAFPLPASRAARLLPSIVPFVFAERSSDMRLDRYARKCNNRIGVDELINAVVPRCRVPPYV